MRRRRRSRSAEPDDFVPTTDGATFRPPFISPRETGRWAIGLLLVSIALAWVSVGIDLSNLRLIHRALAGDDVPRDLRVAQFATEDWLLWAQGLLLVATGTAFIVWLYQARVNLRALGVRRPRFGREWCVWGFVIPGINFFRPYQVLNEIWRASDPATLDAFQWRGQPVPGLLLAWWATFVASLSLRGLALLTELGTGTSLARIQLSVAVLTLADLAAGVAAGLACFVVTRLSDTQEEKWVRQTQDATAA